MPVALSFTLHNDFAHAHCLPQSDHTPQINLLPAMAEGADETDHQPAGRRGACCFAHDGAVYILQGHEDHFIPTSHDVEKSLHRFLLKEGRWDSETTEVKDGISSKLSGACSCLVGDQGQQILAVFGGWNEGLRIADMHILRLNEMRWTKCEISNPGEGPFLKDKAGMVPYGNNMACVVGGYGYPSRHHIHDGVYHGQEGAKYHWDYHNGLCWTNEVHLFNFDSGKWITPEISGQGPPPCAAFTLTMADTCRAVLFGGRQVSMRVNQLYILRLDTWHWEGVFLKSSPDEPWPSDRSFHTMCSLMDTSHVPPVSSTTATTHASPFPAQKFDWLPCLPPDLSPACNFPSLRPCLLLLWGMDNGGQPVADCWTLQLDPISWKRVVIPPVDVCKPRLWHVADVWHPTPAEAQVVVFGGTKGSLYNEPLLDITRGVNDTIVFISGVPTLYTLCVNHLALLPDSALTKLSPLLPTHVRKQIVEQATAAKHPHYLHSFPL